MTSPDLAPITVRPGTSTSSFSGWTIRRSTIAEVKLTCPLGHAKPVPSCCLAAAEIRMQRLPRRAEKRQAEPVAAVAAGAVAPEVAVLRVVVTHVAVTLLEVVARVEVRNNNDARLSIKSGFASPTMTRKKPRRP